MISNSTLEALSQAKTTLSGKRTALIGFATASAENLTRIIHEAEAFARALPANTSPSSDALKPFELILIDIESTPETDWLRADEVGVVLERCIAVGSAHVLMALVTESPLYFRQFCIWPAAAEEILLRCALALRPDSRTRAGSVPAGSTIVLADDDPSITTLVRLTLQRNGFNCEVALNGGDALELVNKVKPCAAVLDVGMPNIDGFEVLSRIRRSPETAQTRVILLTGCEQETDILRGFSLGADDYVTKPFNPMELMMRIKRTIGRI